MRAITIDVINEYIIAELGKLFGEQEDGAGSAKEEEDEVGQGSRDHSRGGRRVKTR